MQSVKFQDDGPNYFFSLNYDGLATSHPNPTFRGQARIVYYKGVNVTRTLIDVARSPSGSGYYEYGVPKGEGGKITPKLAFIQNVPEIDGLVAVGIFIDDVNAVFFKRLLVESGLFALAMPLIALFAFIISRSITKPLSDAVARITRLASGDLSAPPAGAKEKSEIGDVARALDVLHANALEQRALQEKVQEQTKLLIEEKEKAQEAVKAKSEFLANMSHEFRTPMHAILAFSDICLKTLQNGRLQDLQECVQNIKTSGKRLLVLLNDLLDLAKMEAARIEYVRVRADMKEVVERSLRELDGLIKGKNINVDVQFAECAEAEFDKRYMVQVLVNLLSNAIKFSPPESQVSIELLEEHASDGAAGLCCKVIDEGPGVPETELKVVFDKFMQSSRTKTGAGGTGLGLAICRNIIEAHGGRIWAENRKPKGAIFSFVIPKIYRADHKQNCLAHEISDLKPEAVTPC